LRGKRQDATPCVFIDATICNDTNCADVHVFSQKCHLQVTVVLDNLGKGASGAAVQIMNIVMGIDEKTGLES
jgi:N-acetyl-gamma-glutamyl-phosphate reductase